MREHDKLLVIHVELSSPDTNGKVNSFGASYAQIFVRDHHKNRLCGGEGKEDSMRMSEGITGTPFRIFGIHQGPLRFVCFFFLF